MTIPFRIWKKTQVLLLALGCVTCYGQTPHIAPDAQQPTVAQSGANTAAMKTALIAALGALLGVILKDLIFKRWEERRNRRVALDAVFTRYADPLATAATNLMWRLNEVFNRPGRGRFLRLKGVPTARNRYSTFGAYKKISTLYRLAALLGWIRACRREFSYLRLAHDTAARPISEAISAIETALADGPQVEIERLQQLCDLWLLPRIAAEQTESALAVDLESAVGDFLESSGVDELGSLEAEARDHLCAEAARTICKGLDVNCVSAPVIAQTSAQAFEIIAVREAWLYRDWQSAIGDLMVCEVSNRERRFDVIGFSEFEAMCMSGTDEEKKWLSRLSSILDEIDLSVQHRFDHRPKQLKAVLRATAVLIKALSKSRESSQKFSSKTMELADKLASQ